MKRKNITDIIEEHLKETLIRSGEIVIQRNDITTLFGCVPSQVNYVINTRFTQEQGYVVESKRGGAGYIKISRIFHSNRSQMITLLIDKVPMHLSKNLLKEYVTILVKEKIVTRTEARLLLCLNDNLLESDVGQYIRAQLFKQQLNQLKFDDQEG